MVVDWKAHTDMWLNKHDNVCTWQEWRWSDFYWKKLFAKGQFIYLTKFNLTLHVRTHNTNLKRIINVNCIKLPLEWSKWLCFITIGQRGLKPCSKAYHKVFPVSDKLWQAHEYATRHNQVPGFFIIEDRHPSLHSSGWYMVS